jgi:hypothetical protein
MKHLVGLLSLLASIIFLSSCNGGSGFFSASGATNEVMVIMDDSSWEGTSGRALFDVLNSNTKGFPQSSQFGTEYSIYNKPPVIWRICS